MSEQEMRMQYIGVCALLGRLSGRRLEDEENELVELALRDCAALFPGRFEVVRVSSGGWSLEPILSR